MFTCFMTCSKVVSKNSNSSISNICIYNVLLNYTKQLEFSVRTWKITNPVSTQNNYSFIRRTYWLLHKTITYYREINAFPVRLRIQNLWWRGRGVAPELLIYLIYILVETHIVFNIQLLILLKMNGRLHIFQSTTINHTDLPEKRTWVFWINTIYFFTKYEQLCLQFRRQICHTYCTFLYLFL